MNKLCRARAVPSASILHVIQSLRTPLEQMNMLELFHPRSVATACFLGPVGEAGAGGQGVRVLRAEYPFADGQQRGVRRVDGRARVGPARRADQGRARAAPGRGQAGRQPGAADKKPRRRAGYVASWEGGRRRAAHDARTARHEAKAL